MLWVTMTMVYSAFSSLIRSSIASVDTGAVEVAAVQGDAALDARAGDHLVHPVDRAQEARLAAARRADQRGHRPAADRHGDVRDGPEGAVVDVEVLDLDVLAHDHPLGAKARATSRAPRFSA